MNGIGTEINIEKGFELYKEYISLDIVMNMELGLISIRKRHLNYRVAAEKRTKICCIII